MSLDDAVSQLRRRLDRHPPERYPVQHATAQFHLGQALLQKGSVSDAIAALHTSLRWFPEALEVERAKAVNLLGAASRASGDLDAARDHFLRAAATFTAHELPLERGAAVFNLGLVLGDGGATREAAECFAEAQACFAGGAVASETAAVLHLGTTLLQLGDVPGAVRALEQAVALAQRGGDRETVGAASNALGLALLAASRPGDAIASFGLAVAAHPRSIRPGDHAMAKANLALAYRAAGRPAHGRMAASQALATAGAPEPVTRQARTILADLGIADASDLLTVLDEEPAQRWHAIVRDELARWAMEPPQRRRAEAGAWIAGQARRSQRAEELAEAWLTALLELPPDDLDSLVFAAIAATADVDPGVAQLFRSATARAMVRFPVPQLLRLQGRFEQLANESGTTWT